MYENYEEKLNPCACGGKAKFEDVCNISHSGWGKSYLSICVKCTQCGHHSKWLNTIDHRHLSIPEALIDFWNNQQLQVGQIVWDVCECNDGKIRCFKMKVGNLSPKAFRRENECYSIYLADNRGGYALKNFEDINKWLFLTEEAALDRMHELSRRHDVVFPIIDDLK